jgi:hypothetical protein
MSCECYLANNLWVMTSPSLCLELDYDDGQRLLHARKDTSFYVCGCKVDAKVDVQTVTVIEEQSPLFQCHLLVQRIKS